MSENLIGTTRFGCGCIVHVEPDINGITPWLEHWALHGVIEPMLKAVRDGDITQAQRAFDDLTLLVTDTAHSLWISLHTAKREGDKP